MPTAADYTTLSCEIREVVFDQILSGGTNILDGALIVTNPAALSDATDLTVGAATAFEAAIVEPAVSGATVNAAVPEPATLLLLAILGGAAIGWHRRRRGQGTDA